MKCLSAAACAEKFSCDVIESASDDNGLARETEVTKIANWFLARRLLIDVDRLGRILQEDGCRNAKTLFRCLKWAKAANDEILSPTSGRKQL